VTESTPAKQLASFIDKFDPKVATLIRGAPSARYLTADSARRVASICEFVW
jgi:hypothetical protein